ncbi:hypothetical protein KIAC18_003952 [Sporomusa sphaeroides]|uniref:hypothetical protein n=1 Tax=Sporomusa sphaeroides TaxID=47679 RepID=UPI003DA19E2E
MKLKPVEDMAIAAVALMLREGFTTGEMLMALSVAKEYAKEYAEKMPVVIADDLDNRQIAG